MEEAVATVIRSLLTPWRWVRSRLVLQPSRELPNGVNVPWKHAAFAMRGSARYPGVRYGLSRLLNFSAGIAYLGATTKGGRMPQRIGELEKIAAELVDIGKRANDLGELQLAKAIVDSAAIAHSCTRRISGELRSSGRSDSDLAL
jgi:hypothetical protein